MGANIVEKQSLLGFVWEFNLGKRLVFSAQIIHITIPLGFVLIDYFSLLIDFLWGKSYLF